MKKETKSVGAGKPGAAKRRLREIVPISETRPSIRRDLFKFKKIRIEMSGLLAKKHPELLTEAARATSGRVTAIRHQPHFQGDEYHGHASLPGGYEVSWNRSGTRRHPNKFPTTIPRDARNAVAKVLGVDPKILEGFEVVEESGERILLIEAKD
jgi:hypothetical protein